MNMAVTSITLKAVAVASIGLASVSGVETIRYRITPPLIEGMGLYDGTVTAGEIVPIEWTITKRTDCSGEVWRTWSGERGFYLVESLRPSGLPMSEKPVEYYIQTQIPILAPPGELLLSIAGEYDCASGPVKFSLGPVVLTVVE